MYSHFRYNGAKICLFLITTCFFLVFLSTKGYFFSIVSHFVITCITFDILSHQSDIPSLQTTCQQLFVEQNLRDKLISAEVQFP